MSEFISERLTELLDVMQGTDICELVLEEGDTRVRLHRIAGMRAGQREQTHGNAIDVPTVERELVEINSPLVGTFYRSSAPGMAPLVVEGSHVEDGTVVGIVEALQQITEVEAGCRGTIVHVFAEDGQVVEYGQVLFGVHPGG